MMFYMCCAYFVNAISPKLAGKIQTSTTVIKLIPLTGITMPFVSYGGSSMIACMMLLGILEGVSIQNGEMLQDAMYEAGEENA